MNERNDLISTINEVSMVLEFDRLELAKYMLFFNSYFKDEYLKNPYLKQIKEYIFNYMNEIAKRCNYQADLLNKLINYLSNIQDFDNEYITLIMINLINESNALQMQTNGILGKIKEMVISNRLTPRILTVDLEVMTFIPEENYIKWLNEFDYQEKRKLN